MSKETMLECPQCCGKGKVVEYAEEKLFTCNECHYEEDFYSLAYTPLKQERDELLEALKGILLHRDNLHSIDFMRAKQAINKAEGE